ncbi:hypothetical protein [Aestuariivirga sp.]|uniref:hypothetical protein n=1 Tax=Aestuariivirga sp. TaxID=2650926 RepID=UPI0039E5B3BB
MTHRALLALLALSVSAGLLVSPAEARKRYYYYGAPYPAYYPNQPGFIPADPYMRYYSDQYDAEQYGDDDDDQYGNNGFDEDYYQPKLKAANRKASPAQIESYSRSKSAKPVEQASRTVDDAPTGSISKKPVTKPVAAVPATKPVTCDKATSIVQGYGFSGVKSTSCTGSTYAFAATRDGKNYTIKLNAKSGELTDVRKLQ